MRRFRRLCHGYHGHKTYNLFRALPDSRVWGLSQWEPEILKRWDEINLYTMTRGINRFKGLAMILEEIDRKYKEVPDVEAFVLWTGEAAELSNPAVKAQWDLTGKEIYRQALEWSEEVNRRIGTLPEEAKRAFAGCLLYTSPSPRD